MQLSLYVPLPVSLSVAGLYAPQPLSLVLYGPQAQPLCHILPTPVATLSPCSSACMPLSLSVPTSLWSSAFVSLGFYAPPQHLSLYSSAFRSIGVSVSRPLGLYAPSRGHSLPMQLSLYSHVLSVPLFLCSFVSKPLGLYFPQPL